MPRHRASRPTRRARSTVPTTLGTVAGKIACPGSGQFATYLNPAGTPLPGLLPVGVTRVRIRIALDPAPTGIDPHYRMTLAGLGAIVIVTGPSDGSLPM